MLQGTNVLQMFRESPILHKQTRFNSGVNQFGLKPINSYDYLNPTNLVNHGKGTRMDRIDVRRNDVGTRRGGTSLDSLPLSGYILTQMGIIPGDSQHSLEFCNSEAAVLRACMMKGVSLCEAESSYYDQCLSRVSALKREISKSSSRFNDWYITNVSDNFTKPFSHRRQDHTEENAAHAQAMSNRQGHIAYGKRPKAVPWLAKLRRPGMARKSRYPINK